MSFILKPCGSARTLKFESRQGREGGRESGPLLLPRHQKALVQKPREHSAKMVHGLCRLRIEVREIINADKYDDNNCNIKQGKSCR
jgi:hypothetical protein